MATWVEDIQQALTNLGGQATRKQIFAEVKRIRTEPLPKTWKYVIQERMQSCSSDSAHFQGIDLFYRVSPGVWALRNQSQVSKPSDSISESGQVTKSRLLSRDHQVENISSVLRTIREYRDYQEPDSLEWAGYVRDVFSILGFSTKVINNSLFMIGLLGSSHMNKAMVAFIRPGNSLDLIADDFSWESILHHAASFYELEWGILTDGMQLRVYRYQGHKAALMLNTQNFDEIIQDERTLDFLRVYELVSQIKGKAEIREGSRKQKKEEERSDLSNNKSYIFWDQLLEKAKHCLPLYKNISLSKSYKSFINAGSGRQGIHYSFVLHSHNAQISLYIDRGEKEWNKRAFHFLEAHKSRIEGLFGAPLIWDLLPDKRASRIDFIASQYGRFDEGRWEEIQEQMVEAMTKFEKAFSPFLRQIR